MRRFWPLLLFVAMLAGVLLRPDGMPQPVSSPDYPRIVSLAPSITEILFAVDAGDRLVAVTDYCRYPPQARRLPSVGGYVDTSLEAILAARPDLVIMLDRQQALQTRLRQLGVDTLSVDHASVGGILDSIEAIGRVSDRHAQADMLVGDIRMQIDAIRTRVAHRPPVRTLVAIGHDVSSPRLREVYIAGRHDFYNELLSLAGGENVYRDSLVKVPALTVEGIMRLNPQVIIDIVARDDLRGRDADSVKRQWQALEQVDAVKHNRVHIIDADHAVIPGPRIFALLTSFAELLHPQLTGVDNEVHD